MDLPQPPDVEDDDSWGNDVPVKDLAQSSSDAEEGAVADGDAPSTTSANKNKAQSGSWESEDSADLYVNEGDDDDDNVGKLSKLDLDDGETSTKELAQRMYALEIQLLDAASVSELQKKNTQLTAQLEAKDAELNAERTRWKLELAEKDLRLLELRSTQMEILQAMAVMKKNQRTFQQSIMQVLETLPAERAAKELSSLIGQMIVQQRARDAAAEERDMQDDAAVLARMEHPIEKLMKLTRNVNPQEASFILVRFFCRLEGQFARPGAPLMAVTLENAFRFWEVTADFHLYPLYSFMVTHFRQRIFRVGESTQHLLYLVSTLCVLFFVYRSEFDPSEGTDIVFIRNLQQVLLGLDESSKGDDELPTSISGAQSKGPMGKRIVKTKRALWIELRSLIVLAYAHIIRNEGEAVESCIRQTLDEIRKTATEGEIKYDMSDRCSEGMQKILKRLVELKELMLTNGAPKSIRVQIVGQLCAMINGHCCNSLMLRRSYATMFAAAAFRADLRHLDTWLKENVSPDALPWVLSKLAPLSEMVNVLFMNKNLLRRAEIRQEVCPHLSAAQLCQILTTYEPQKGEEPVSLSLIQMLMSETPISRSHQADISSVLVDVALLAPLDLSVQKPDWMTCIPLHDLKTAPFPYNIFEDFIFFRDRNLSSKRDASSSSPTKM